MNEKLKAVALSLSITVSAAGAQGLHTMESEKYIELQKQYNDTLVESAYRKASANVAGLLDSLKRRYGALTPTSAPWQKTLSAAITSAQAGNWQEAQAQIDTVLKEKKNALDVYLFGGIVSAKAGDPTQAMSHLETLYQLNKEQKDDFILTNAKIKKGGLLDSVVNHSSHYADPMDGVLRGYEVPDQ